MGFEYEWSRTSPSEIAETVIANTAKAEVTNILTRMIGREIELTNQGFKIRQSADERCAFAGDRLSQFLVFARVLGAVYE
jgi:hypothetical protein